MSTAVWFTNGLRTKDHKALSEALLTNQQTIAFFVHEKVSSTAREKFITESLLDLSHELSKLNIPLYVFRTISDDDLIQFLANHQIKQIYSSKAFNSKKRNRQIHLETLNPQIQFNYFNSETLLDLELYNMNSKNVDDTFTVFRKKVEQSWIVSPIIDPPQAQAQTFAIEAQYEKYILKSQPLDSHSPFTGGRTQALARLNYYLFESQKILSYKETRNGLIDFDDSSKLSPWLSLGCISAKEIYWSVKEFENEIEANESTYWLIFELLWRDHFKFLAEKYQDKFFDRSGLNSKNKNFQLTTNTEIFENWKTGKTDNDFINANMIELLKTGWMSNRGRQNVANYLVKTMKIDWTWGAEWFAQNLIDYDPENNWGNWLYQSGYGTDPRDRVFNPALQAQIYDPDNKYQSIWLNESRPHGK